MDRDGDTARPGRRPADHHTLAMALHPHTGYVHPASATDLDESRQRGLPAERGYPHAYAWAVISRAPRSSTLARPGQVDLLHYSDGDVFDARWIPAAPRCPSAAWPSRGRRRPRSSPASTTRVSSSRLLRLCLLMQRVLLARAARADQGDELMSARLPRTATAGECYTFRASGWPPASRPGGSSCSATPPTSPRRSSGQEPWPPGCVRARGVARPAQPADRTGAGDRAGVNYRPHATDSISTRTRYRRRSSARPRTPSPASQRYLPP